MTENKPQNGRPTIGFLTHEIWGTFGSLFWSGIINATEEEDVNLICFPGGNLRPTQEAPANVIYNLASDQNVDGLVISASSLASFIELEDFQAFCARYRPLPMVNLAATLEGIPAVLVDNYQGIRDVVTHLVDVHNCRRIAFIPGPLGNAEAHERYRAYTDALDDYGIPFDPDLVAPPGDWNPPSGSHAIHVLLDQRGMQFDAVVTANDRMATGVLETLQARGMIVPDDVIVTGFDDSEEAWFLTPPLTTVRQPMREHFRQATKMVLAQIRGESVPEQVTIPVKLVVRQSCGCLDPRVMQTAVTPVTTMGSTFEEALTARRDEILREMSHVMADSAACLPPGWAARLLDEFAVGMEKKSADGFLLTLDRALRQVIAAGSNVADWREVLAVMRRYVLPHLDHEELLWAEYLCQKANVMIGEVARRIDMRQAWQKMEQARLLGNTEAALITSFDVARLMDVLVERLPTLDIPSCYLSLYEDPAAPDGWARLILAYKEQERVTLKADGLRFPSWHLMPERFWPRERRYHLVVEPLYFRDKQLGFAVFEAGTRDGDVYEMLRRGLSSALQGALLVRRVQENSAELMRRERLSALGQLTATVAHEIRNPLGTVRTAVFSIGDAIERDEINRVERALQLAERNIVRCDAIITELLDYTRDQVLQLSPIQIDSWLERLLDEALDQRSIPENVTCVRELHADIEVPLDSEHLRRAITNVVDNAVDAMQEAGPVEGGHRLTVSTHVRGDRIDIQISDTGRGVPAEMMDRIFEPLFSTKSFGVGLGLSIVKSIMDQHGGGIEISSQAGQGTTVTLWLPLSENRGD
jgi:DNA-binding LacI/PurR family transcriptional regulator/signal transduction histidine kinase